jgi:uncharacterized protein
MQNLFIINNLEFAKNQLTLDGDIELVTLTRLSEMLTNASQSQLRFKLIGTGKQFSQPGLNLVIKANLQMLCQRCLDEMTIDLNLRYNYLISNVALAEAEDADELDWLEAAVDMNVQELIEDELLLALPIAPTHAHDCSKLIKQSGDKPNPFAVLKTLKKS